MKRTTGVILCFFITILSSSTHAQSNAEAIAHLRDIGSNYNELKRETWQYLKAITRGKNARKVENKRQKLLSEIRTVKYEIKKIRPYQQDNSYKLATIQYLDLTYKVLNEDFDKVLDMEDIAEQSYDMMEAYLLAKERANEKLDSASALVHAAEGSYAAKYNIILSEGDDDKMSQKIKQANLLLSYYNDLYLIFFKSYKQEAYVLDALQRDDVSALEQNINTLATFSNEGLEKLNEIKNFQGDASLKSATQQILHFYKNEAEKEFTAMVDFYIKKDAFEKSQKAIDSKNKKSRTQQDIDQYNKAVDEYNNAAQKFNGISDATNKRRGKYLDEWNGRVEKFFDTHSM